MKNKYQRMNEFFIFLKNVLKENPTIDFYNDKNNTLYSILVKFDIDRELNNNTLDATGTFENWIRRMSKIERMDISMDPSKSSFEIKKLDKRYYNPREFIFVQAPLDQNHIEQGINLIIDFLNREKIEHITSITKSIKSDNVIIKIPNPNDLDKICDFINNNDYIKEGLIKINPFIFNYKGLGITTGNKIPYNSTLIEYIKIYLKIMTDENKIDSISSNDFIIFLNEYYNKVFINRSELDNHIAYFKLENIKDLTNTIVNYMNITELIIQAYSEDYNIEMFLEHYKEYKNSMSFNEKMVKFQQFNITDEAVKTTNELLAILFEYFSFQYDEELAIANLELYITQNKSELITKQNRLREKLSESNFTANMLYLLQKSKKSLREYLQQLNIYKKTEEEKKQEVDSIIVEILNVYCNNHDAKENKKVEEVISLIKKFYETKDYRILTRTNKIRSKVATSFFLVKLSEILENESITLEQYILKIIEKNKIIQANFLENAIIETYKKYERLKVKYEEGQLSNNNTMQFVHSGKETVIYAMNEFISLGSYRVFTRDNNARQKLEENITPIEAINIMRKALNISSSNEKATIEELNYLIPNYIDLILKSYETKKIL